MSEIKEIVVDPQEEPKVDPIQPSDLDSLDVKELVRIIKETRGDAASNRIAAKDLQTKLDKIAAGEKKEKEDDLKKKGEFELNGKPIKDVFISEADTLEWVKPFHIVGVSHPQAKFSATIRV